MKKAKCAGYIFQNKAATTAGLMDNAVQAVEMDLRRGKQHAQEAADPHYSMIVESNRRRTGWNENHLFLILIHIS